MYLKESHGCHGTGKTGNLKFIFPDSDNTGNLSVSVCVCVERQQYS